MNYLHGRALLSLADFIGLDKSGYQVHVFLISSRKHMVWVLIRSTQQGGSNEYHNIRFRGDIRKYQYFWTEKSALTRLCL